MATPILTLFNGNSKIVAVRFKNLLKVNKTFQIYTRLISIAPRKNSKFSKLWKNLYSLRILRIIINVFKPHSLKPTFKHSFCLRRSQWNTLKIPAISLKKTDYPWRIRTPLITRNQTIDKNRSQRHKAYYWVINLTNKNYSVRWIKLFFLITAPNNTPQIKKGTSKLSGYKV